MGAAKSKERLLYNSIRKGDIHSFRSLHSQGASLNCMSTSHKTPFILASSAAKRFEIAKALLDLGADVNYYDPKHSVGTAIQNAAKRGLEQTVILLLSHGADPLLRNKYGLNALDYAQHRHYTGIVHAIEKEVCLFSGCFRVTGGNTDRVGKSAKKIRAVVLPSESKLSQRRIELNIALYADERSARPLSVISLEKYSLQEPDFTAVYPYLLLRNKSNGFQIKLLCEEEGNVEGLRLLYNTCMAELTRLETDNEQRKSAQKESGENLELASAVEFSLALFCL